MEYKIKGRTFYQEKLKLIQIKQILPYTDTIIKSLSGKKGISVVEFVTEIESDITDIIAIILVEKDKSLKEKDIKELSTFLDNNLEYDILINVITDFFIVMPISLITEKLATVMTSISKTMSPTIK